MFRAKPSVCRSRSWVCFLLGVGGAAVFFLGETWAQAPRAADADTNALGTPVTILDGSGLWRALYSWAPPLVQTKDQVRQRRSESRRARPSERPDFRFMTRYPPDDWRAAGFNDGVWARRHFFVKYVHGENDSRAGGGSGSPYLRQLALRAKFTVTDPSKVGRLWLTMAFRGGAVVYLNGTELGRAHLPAGRLQPGSPAEIYPLGAYLKPNGRPWHWWNDRSAIGKEAYPLRVRRLDRLAVPAGLLRRGLNVLAVEIHAAPYPEAFVKALPAWGTCGLIELRLQADRPTGLVPNVVRPKGLQVWNTNTAEQVHDVSWGDPHERLFPIAMAAARNGCGSGRVVVSSDRPMTGLRAEVSDLIAPGGAKLPRGCAKVRYGKFDSLRPSRWGGSSDQSRLQWGRLPRMRDDALLSSPPGEVPLSVKAMPHGVPEARVADGLPAKLVAGAVQPVWVVADVPKAAAPGDYRGRLTIHVEGHQPIHVPVHLKVIDWTLPDPADYTYWMGMIQSPEGVALTYGAGLWSDRHCELVARSLEWLGKLGTKVLYIPLGAESQYGNEQSMVLWVRGTGGMYTHDFRRVERYVDLALKHMGRPRFVVVGVWDSSMHVSVPKRLKRKSPRFSILDPKTGKVANADSPGHGTPQSLAFWRPVLTRVRAILAKRGLAEAMLLGYCADRQPDKATVSVFRKILPDVGWQATRHAPRGHDTLACEGGTVPIRYQPNVWGGWTHHDPATKRVYGWRHPTDRGLRCWLDRSLFDACPIVQFRTACEQALLAERHGLGQIGADFWPPRDGGERYPSTLVGRFPATSEGNLGIYAGQLLYPARASPRRSRAHPVPTARYQMMRENIQECEARIFLERLLLETPSRLPADLAGKIQSVLDERTRWHRALLGHEAPETFLSWPYSRWEARTVELYEAAAGAARALSRPAGTK